METAHHSPAADVGVEEPPRRSAKSGLREPPVTKTGLILWLLAYVVLTGVAILVGFLIVDHLDAVQDLDRRVARWLGDERTDGWTSMSWWGSGLAESFVKIAAAAALSAFFLWKFRRWSEATLLVGALVLEVMIFTTSSFVVDRARPGVPKLDTIPPTSSFPSGHAAAAVAFYGALAIIVFWHTRHRVARAVVVGAAIVFPLIVGASRMYRGMHHLSDVIVGFVVGGMALWVTYLVVNGIRSRSDATDAPVPGYPTARPPDLASSRATVARLSVHTDSGSGGSIGSQSGMPKPSRFIEPTGRA